MYITLLHMVVAYYKNTRKAHKTLHIENKVFDIYCVSNTWGWQIIVHLRLKNVIDQSYKYFEQHVYVIDCLY